MFNSVQWLSASQIIEHWDPFVIPELRRTSAQDKVIVIPRAVFFSLGVRSSAGLQSLSRGVVATGMKKVVDQ